jgi:hypothetical protein
MTGGYRPWSKFNAHSWSLLNARQQFQFKITSETLEVANHYFRDMHMLY